MQMYTSQPLERSTDYITKDMPLQPLGLAVPSTPRDLQKLLQGPATKSVYSVSTQYQPDCIEPSHVVSFKNLFYLQLAHEESDVVTTADLEIQRPKGELMPVARR